MQLRRNQGVIRVISSGGEEISREFLSWDESPFGKETHVQVEKVYPLPIETGKIPAGWNVIFSE